MKLYIDNSRINKKILKIIILNTKNKKSNYVTFIVDIESINNTTTIITEGSCGVIETDKEVDLIMMMFDNKLRKMLLKILEKLDKLFFFEKNKKSKLFLEEKLEEIKKINFEVGGD